MYPRLTSPQIYNPSGPATQVLAISPTLVMQVLYMHKVKSYQVFFSIIMRIFIELEILLKNIFYLLSWVVLGIHGPWYVNRDQRTTLGSQLSFSIWWLNSGQEACTPRQQVFLPAEPSCCHSLQKILYERLKITLEHSTDWTFRLSPTLQIPLWQIFPYIHLIKTFVFSISIKEIKFQ